MEPGRVPGLRERAVLRHSRGMTLPWTLALLAFGLALAAFSWWYQERPKELGEVRLFPAPLGLGIGITLVVLALAHLLTLETGVELRGRHGF